MDRRTTLPTRATRSRHRPPANVRRPGAYLAVAAAGAVLVHVFLGADPAAQSDPAASGSVSVARELGLTASSAPADTARDLRPLQQLAASRGTREAAESAAQRSQAAADKAVLDRQKAQAAAEAKSAAEAAARTTTAQPPTGSAAPAPSGVAATRVATIINSAGSVRPQVQAAADAVVSNVPGAAGITLGGTRASATDPNGHPSGRALDYMVGSDAALGDAIARYQIDHWTELGVEYVIWQQRMLSSPGGSWVPMADRGSPTENHMDHVHVNYRG